MMNNIIDLRNFELSFKKTSIEISEPSKENDMEKFGYFFKNYGGLTYNNGLLRFHTFNSSDLWNNLIGHFFPKYVKKICCFAFDWYGRQYAVDLNDENKLYMFDSASFEDFELESNISIFLNFTLVETQFDTLLIDEYENWRERYPFDILFNECVGFKVPLFLGGQEVLENLEIQDMIFYWDFNYQLFNSSCS